MMSVDEAQLFQRCTVRREAVGNDHLRRNGISAQQTPQQLQCRARIASCLHHEIEDDTFIVDGPPKIHLCICTASRLLVQNWRPATRVSVSIYQKKRRIVGGGDNMSSLRELLSQYRDSARSEREKGNY